MIGTISCGVEKGVWKDDDSFPPPSDYPACFQGSPKYGQYKDYLFINVNRTSCIKFLFDKIFEHIRNKMRFDNQ